MDEDECLCQKNSRINEESPCEDVWKELGNLYNKCHAVKFLIPCFESWFKYNKEPEETAFHQSTLVLALRRGHLDRITSPIHRYCLSNEKPLCKQYEKDLRETWFSRADYLNRHKKSRIWMGRMAELKVAEWLEGNGWNVEEMEAWGGKNDIKAISPENGKTLIEVKYIGQEDEDFKHLVAHLAGGSAIQSYNPYKAFNFALLKIFEAAYQLSPPVSAKQEHDCSNSRKEVALVISASTWDAMKIPLKNWMGRRYCFFEKEVEQDISWCKFLRNTIKSQENLEKSGNDLFNMMPAAIKTLNKISISKINSWSLEEMLAWSPSGNKSEA